MRPGLATCAALAAVLALSGCAEMEVAMEQATTPTPSADMAPTAGRDRRGRRGSAPPARPSAHSKHEPLSANMTETPAPLGITVGRWR